MISRKIGVFVFFSLVLALTYGGCGGSGGGSGPQPTPAPTPTPQPTPTPTPSPGACNSPSLNNPYVDGGSEVFYSFIQAGSTLDTKLFSDGSTVYVLVSDGTAIFGFKGIPVGGGTSCALFSASVDYDMDGVFDETAERFESACLRLGNGSEFTFIDGPSKVNASQQFEDDMLVLYNQVLFFNVFDPLDCESVDPVASSGIYESLLSQLEEQGNTL